MSQALQSALENKELINLILTEFNKKISHLENHFANCGLLSGLTGDLLFLYQLSQYAPELVDESLFNDKLDFLQSQLPKNIDRLEFGNGLSGQGWFLEYINQAQGDDYEAELCDEIDSILLEKLSVKLWQHEIEAVLGLSGVAIYAGRRQLKNGPETLFLKIIEHFEHSAIQITANTLTWSQPGNSAYRFNTNEPDTPEYNLGLAHGVPGIIAALLPALVIPSLFDRTRHLLIQSCDWLLEQELDSDDNISCFSSTCNDAHSSRLGWCYGDLTIALTLARVGNALNISAYSEKAKEIALHSALRDEKHSMIKDAGLCHGSVGLTFIFQLLDQQLNEPRLLQAANKWLTYSLDLYRNQGIEGFYMYSNASKKHEESTGLIMGFGGIGLCLLAALGEDANWVDCLLMA